MGDTKFTFLELHLDGARFSPRGIVDLFTGSEESDERAVETVDEDVESSSDESSGGPGALGVLVGLVVLVGIAVAVKKFRGDDEEQTDLEEFEEPDVVVDDD